ncbi:hypothetical protein G3I44_08500 [Halogeometricum borinquense]|uniref:PepSY domain-containing protein n=1 Tax=Halogeometricum borinquense TaxID=60847 RepID=A0A6C0UGI2_9EURY|nr:hypothetical protein [Halogeometricum borinquense]QIB74317.1 hypothetical protein G3I44_08500 [Halogeometricum borinquense]
MTSEIRSRLFILVGLSVLGVSLAVIGTSLGVTSPVTNSDDNAKFVVNQENMTFSSAGESVTLAQNMSEVETVQITQVKSSQFEVHTEKEQPFTAAERDRAIEIARNNETVRRHLEQMDEYTLAVDPVQKINASSTSETSGTISQINGSDTETGSELTVQTGNMSVENESSVVIQRESSYVEDQAVVRVRQPNEPELQELKYSIDIDLANGTVTDITDWDKIRQ